MKSDQGDQMSKFYSYGLKLSQARWQFLHISETYLNLKIPQYDPVLARSLGYAHRLMHLYYLRDECI